MVFLKGKRNSNEHIVVNPLLIQKLAFTRYYSRYVFEKGERTAIQIIKIAYFFGRNTQ